MHQVEQLPDDENGYWGVVEMQHPEQVQ